MSLVAVVLFKGGVEGLAGPALAVPLLKVLRQRRTTSSMRHAKDKVLAASQIRAQFVQKYM